jgi:hypothetical protein
MLAENNRDARLLLSAVFVVLALLELGGWAWRMRVAVYVVAAPLLAHYVDNGIDCWQTPAGNGAFERC